MGHASQPFVSFVSTGLFTADDHFAEIRGLGVEQHNPNTAYNFWSS